MMEMALQDSNPEVSAQTVTTFSPSSEAPPPHYSEAKGGTAPAPLSFYTHTWDTHTHTNPFVPSPRRFRLHIHPSIHSFIYE